MVVNHTEHVKRCLSATGVRGLCDEAFPEPAADRLEDVVSNRDEGRLVTVERGMEADVEPLGERCSVGVVVRLHLSHQPLATAFPPARGSEQEFTRASPHLDRDGVPCGWARTPARSSSWSVSM